MNEDWAIVEFWVAAREFRNMNPALLALLRRVVPTEVRHDFARNTFYWTAYVPEVSAKSIGQTDMFRPASCFIRHEALGKHKFSLVSMDSDDVLLHEVER